MSSERWSEQTPTKRKKKIAGGERARKRILQRAELAKIKRVAEETAEAEARGDCGDLYMHKNLPEEAK